MCLPAIDTRFSNLTTTLSGINIPVELPQGWSILLPIVLENLPHCSFKVYWLWFSQLPWLSELRSESNCWSGALRQQLHTQLLQMDNWSSVILQGLKDVNSWLILIPIWRLRFSLNLSDVNAMLRSGLLHYNRNWCSSSVITVSDINTTCWFGETGKWSLMNLPESNRKLWNRNLEWSVPCKRSLILLFSISNLPSNLMRPYTPRCAHCNYHRSTDNEKTNY